MLGVEASAYELGRSMQLACFRRIEQMETSTLWFSAVPVWPCQPGRRNLDGSDEPEA